MKHIVVDASFAGLINLADEIPSEDALARCLSAWKLLVPAHWHLEIANMLVKAERRGRLDRKARDRVLQNCRLLPVVVDLQTPNHSWTDVLPLADTYKLTVYDAAYLELALRTGAALASHDDRLITAAREAGIELLTAQA